MIKSIFFELAKEREPGHWLAHTSLIVSLAPKWSGLPMEDTFTFARQAAAEGGGALAALPVMAHIEAWNNHFFDDDEKGAAVYFKQPDVIAEVARCEAALKAAVPESRGWTMRPWNMCAFARHLAGDAAALAPLMQKIGWAKSEYPWYYTGNAPGTFAAARKLAGIK